MVKHTSLAVFLAAFMVACFAGMAALASLVAGTAQAQSADLWFLEAESMNHNASSVVGSSASSGGKVLRFSRIGGAMKDVAVTRTTEDIYFKARSAKVTGGRWPIVAVSVNGIEKFRGQVNSSTYAEFRATPDTPPDADGVSQVKFSVVGNMSNGQQLSLDYIRGVGSAPPLDTDGDGVSDSSDNCDDVDNPNQTDTDGDGIGDACDSPPPTGDSAFPGIRWYPLMGTYAGADKGWVSEPNLIDEQYAEYVGSANEDEYLDLDADDERYYFCGGRKITWKDVLVNPAQAPTSRAQAQDPNWSNYKWNQNDVIEEQLDNSSAVAQGKAKLCIFAATTATSVQNPVPQWMMADPDNLTWTDGQGKDHVRFDKPEAVNHTADFLIALSKQYGDDPRVASITHGEYYTNSDGGGLPADFNYDKFRSDAKNIWSQVIAGSPRDASGERVNFVQSQPIVQGGFVTAQDIANIGVGVSGSGANLFQGGELDQVRPQLYGEVPLQHQVNTGPLGSPATWDGTPNSFGFSKGQTVPIKYEHVTWYYGSKGVAPLDSLMMRDDSSYTSQWHEAYQQFGPNGSKVANWSQIPNRGRR